VLVEHGMEVEIAIEPAVYRVARFVVGIDGCLVRRRNAIVGRGRRRDRAGQDAAIGPATTLAPVDIEAVVLRWRGK